MKQILMETSKQTTPSKPSFDRGELILNQQQERRDASAGTNNFSNHNMELVDSNRDNNTNGKKDQELTGTHQIQSEMNGLDGMRLSEDDAVTSNDQQQSFVSQSTLENETANQNSLSTSASLSYEPERLDLETSLSYSSSLKDNDDFNQDSNVLNGSDTDNHEIYPTDVINSSQTNHTQYEFEPHSMQKNDIPNESSMKTSDQSVIANQKNPNQEAYPVQNPERSNSLQRVNSKVNLRIENETPNTNPNQQQQQQHFSPSQLHQQGSFNRQIHQQQQQLQQNHHQLSTATISQQQYTDQTANLYPPVPTSSASMAPTQQTMTTPSPNPFTTTSETHLDSILNSPRPKDEIVEKSPGGRYLRFSEKLGLGAYKEVYRAYDTIEGIEVAWNIVNLSCVPKAERQYIVNEVRLLEKLNHSNIISFHGSWVNRELEQVIFVTEILSSGTLKSFINKVQVIRWKIAKRWAIQILKGLEYMHSHDPPVIHRDLKCDNIFINGTSGDLRIGDLGLSTVMYNRSKALSVLGTPEFMAPELYEESYDEKVDIYAFGMCMLEIFTKEAPYRECTNPAQIYKKVSSGVEPECLSRIRNDDAKQFIRLCIGRNGRPTASELLHHPFLTFGVDDDWEVEVDPPLLGRSISETTLQHSAGPLKNILTSHDASSQNLPLSENEVVLQQRSLETMNESKMQRGSLQKQMSVDIPISSSEGDDRRSISNQSNQHYYSIPTDQGLGVIVAQVDLPMVDSGTPINHTISEGHELVDDLKDLPDREMNIKNVKVLMGRGKEIEQIDSVPAPQHLPMKPPLVPSTPPPMTPSSPSIEETKAKPINNDFPVPVSSSIHSESSSKISEVNEHNDNIVQPIQQRLVMAALIEDRFAESDYADDVMKLMITLTLGDEKKYVQFDFHLVQDDPITVAREMVTELNIPEDGLSEIIETISGLARSALMRQGNKRNDAEIQSAASNVFEYPESGAHSFIPPSLLGDNMAIESSPANFDHSLEQNANAPAVVYQDDGDTIKPTHITTLSDMPDHLSLAAAEAVQSILNDQQQLPSNNHQLEIEVKTYDVMNASDNILPSTSPTSNLADLLSNTDDITIEDCLSIGSDMSESEYMQLKQDFENKLKRTKKVFSTRMEKLQRSKEEKEAEYLKNVAKHEKEKAALEKRVRQEEEEQNQRLQKILDEWETKFALAKKTKKSSSSDGQSLSFPASADNSCSDLAATKLSAGNVASPNDDQARRDSAISTPSLNSCQDESVNDNSR